MPQPGKCHASRGASRRGAAPLLVAVAAAALLAGSRMTFALFAGAEVSPSLLLPSRTGRLSATIPLRAAEAEVVMGSDGNAQLMKLEDELKIQIEKAQAADNPNRVRDLARLLVLAKTAEGIAVKEGATDASNAVQTAVAESLSNFVGKEDYDFGDVYAEIQTRGKKAVAALDDLYFEDVSRELNLASQAAVARFTGKEDYKFGDISKEIDSRAKAAISVFTGKADYKFGDITNEALKRGTDAVKGFTGKEDYKFGDITKTLLKNIFGGEDKK